MRTHYLSPKPRLRINRSNRQRHDDRIISIIRNNLFFFVVVYKLFSFGCSKCQMPSEWSHSMATNECICTPFFHSYHLSGRTEQTQNTIIITATTAQQKQKLNHRNTIDVFLKFSYILFHFSSRKINRTWYRIVS